jgi:ABC-type proline/glycine betaine transport system permease subunit
MYNAILEVLKIMGWLGAVLGILIITNTITGTLANVWHNKEEFSWKRMLQGLVKSAVFYVSALFISVAFTMLPYINEMITTTFGEVLISNDVLNTLSSVGVLGVVIAVIVVQAKKAIENVVRLANSSAVTEEITWDVIEDEEELIELEEEN